MEIWLPPTFYLRIQQKALHGYSMNLRNPRPSKELRLLGVEPEEFLGCRDHPKNAAWKSVMMGSIIAGYCLFQSVWLRNKRYLFLQQPPNTSGLRLGIHQPL